MAIGQFLVYFFLAPSFSACIDGRPTIFCSIISASAYLISRLWKYDLLLSTLFRIVQLVTWLLVVLFSVLVVS